MALNGREWKIVALWSALPTIMAVGSILGEAVWIYLVTKV